MSINYDIEPSIPAVQQAYQELRAAPNDNLGALADAYPGTWWQALDAAQRLLGTPTGCEQLHVPVDERCAGCKMDVD